MLAMLIRHARLLRRFGISIELSRDYVEGEDNGLRTVMAVGPVKWRLRLNRA